MIGPTQSTSLTPMRGRGRVRLRGRRRRSAFRCPSDPLSPLFRGDAVRRRRGSVPRRATAGSDFRLWPIRRTTTAPTISVAATRVIGVTCSPSTTAPERDRHHRVHERVGRCGGDRDVVEEPDVRDVADERADRGPGRRRPRSRRRRCCRGGRDRARRWQRPAMLEQHAAGDHLHRDRGERLASATARCVRTASRAPRGAGASSTTSVCQWPAPLPPGRTRSTIPASPIAMPIAAVQLIHRPPNAGANSAIQSGTVAMMSATNPLGRYCSPQATPPLPKSSRHAADDQRRSPVDQGEPLARRARAVCEREEQQTGEDESRARHEQRGDGLDRDVDREVRRSPDDVHRGKGDHDLSARRLRTGDEGRGHVRVSFVMIQSDERTDTLSHHRTASV